jgi:hypothetical protein
MSFNRAIRDFSGHDAVATLVLPEMTRMIIPLPEIGRRLLLWTGWVLRGGRLLLPGNCLFSAFIWCEYRTIKQEIIIYNPLYFNRIATNIAFLDF